MPESVNEFRSTSRPDVVIDREERESRDLLSDSIDVISVCHCVQINQGILGE
jgi:hypothetical protein